MRELAIIGATRVEAMCVAGQRDDVIGDPTQPARRGGRRAFGVSQPCPSLKGRIFYRYGSAVAAGLAAGAVEIGELVSCAPDDGEVAGVALRTGKAPAPESGAAEEPDPGDA